MTLADLGGFLSDLVSAMASRSRLRVGVYSLDLYSLYTEAGWRVHLTDDVVDVSVSFTVDARTLAAAGRDPVEAGLVVSKAFRRAHDRLVFDARADVEEAA